MADHLGKQIGRFKLARLLGQGSIGKVYLGEGVLKGSSAAVKILDRRLTHPETEQIQKYLSFVANLKHPHILPLRDFDQEEDGTTYLVTDYVPSTLRQHFPWGTPHPPSAILPYIWQIADALQYAHDSGIIHGNLLPSEVLLDKDDEIFLDFTGYILKRLLFDTIGRARLPHDYFYLPPEYWTEDLHAASDQYDLGLIVYELLTDTHPFNSDLVERVAYQHQYVSPPSLCKKVSSISASVDTIVRAALSKDPMKRFPSAQEFVETLDHAIIQPSGVKVSTRVGERIGNYQLTRLIGAGGLAEVYLGEQVFLKKQAAVKLLHSRLTDDASKRTFRDEAKTIAHLDHPNILRVLEYGEEQGLPFLVMTYAPDGTLRHRHLQGVQLPLTTVVAYVKQVAHALQYAHDQKVIHRDVKPENMLVGKQHEILLSDFGIAVTAHSTGSQQRENVAGTPTYMAPEQFQGEPQKSSDQYSLAIVVYEWLCGMCPFKGDLMQLAYQHGAVSPAPLRNMVPTLSPQVEQVVLKALAKDPKARFPSVQEFAQSLEEASRSHAA